MSGPASSSPSGVEIGRVVERRYRVLALLGRGGMGVVARAEDLRLGRDVALKLLPPEAVGDAQARARLLREARAMAAFTHTSVVHVYDVGETDDGGAYLAMELVDGETLRKKLGGAWPLAARLQALAEIARALGAAHRSGLIHRDVKPDNVMVRADGRALLLDFGIARVEATSLATVDAVKLTGPDMVVGTLAYMSPEQACAGPLDGRSDQFSFAVMAFEVLTGALPWPGTTAAAILSALLTQPAPPVSSCAAVPSALDAVLARALEKKPEQRHASMDALADALEAAAAESPGATVGAASDAFARTEPARTPARSSEAFAATVAAPTPRSGDAAPLAASPASAPQATRSRPTARLALGAIALAGAALVLGALSARGRSPERPGSLAPDASAPASASPTSRAAVVSGQIDELAAGTSNPAARAAFLAGYQTWRDAGSPLAMLDKARTLDPSYGAAHLWYAVALADGGAGLEARSAFGKASEARASLSPRNRVLLDALAPCSRSEPVDTRACVTKLEAAAHADAEAAYLFYLLGSHRGDVGPSDAYLADMDRVIAIDPEGALPLQAKGWALAYLGRFDEARSALDRCVELAPGAASCFQLRIQIASQRGDCAGVEADARRWQAAAPDDPTSISYLVNAALAKGLPAEALHEMNAQYGLKIPEAQRGWWDAWMPKFDAVLRGDFTAARRAVADVDRKTEPRSDRLYHYLAAYMSIELALEMGQGAEAARIADDALRRKGAWIAEPRSDEVAITGDIEPYFLDVLRETGKLSSRERADRREAWLRTWRPRASPFYERYLWLNAYAPLVDDEEEAREAEAALPAGGIPPFYPSSTGVGVSADLGIGKMHLLLGRAAEALPYLRRAAQGCAGTDDLVLYVRAALPLGQALEKTGDRDGACRAYASVVARWGKAKPRSVTAEKARAAARALRCPAPG